MHLFIYSTYWSICLFLYVQSWGFPESMFASVFRPNFRICLCLVFYQVPQQQPSGEEVELGVVVGPLLEPIEANSVFPNG